MNNLEFEEWIRLRSLALYKIECQQNRQNGKWKREGYKINEIKTDINLNKNE